MNMRFKIDKSSCKIESKSEGGISLGIIISRITRLSSIFCYKFSHVYIRKKHLQASCKAGSTEIMNLIILKKTKIFLCNHD